MNRDVAIHADRNAVSERVALAEQPISQDQFRPHQMPRLDPAAILRIINEWRWMIAGASVLGLALGLTAALLTTPLYRAWVTMEVNPLTIEVTEEQGRQRQQQAEASWDFIATQIGLLSSRTLAERVAQELNLVSSPAVAGSGDATSRLRSATNIVSNGLSVEVPEEGRLIRFSYTSADPGAAAQIANGIADGFINSNLQRRYEASNYARRFLERQIAKSRRDLETSERQLVAYAQAEGIISLGGGGEKGGSPNEGGQSLQSASLSALNDALAAATTKRVAAEGAYRAALSSGPTTEVNQGTQGLRQARAAVEAEYQEKRTLLKPDHPDMLSLRSRIDELDRQIARETAQVSGGRSNSLAQEYRGALAAERSLQSRVAALKGSVLDLRGRSVRYSILQREVDTNRGLYDALLQRYKEIGVAGGIGTAPVSIVDRAEVPQTPFKPNLPYNVFVGLAIGLMAGVGAAIGLELLNDTIKTRDDVRRKLQLACLGAIPRRKGKDVSFLDDLADPGSGTAEAYSAVAASLRFTTEEGVPRSLLVTSTKDSEGKSSSALALAQNLGRQGKSVLLIDADLRRPSFKIKDQTIGLSRLLTAHEDLRAHAVPTMYENLWLVPCGELPPNPADLLSTARFGQVLREANQQFDIVILDAPPVLGLADAPLLASTVAGVLFVVESGRTRTRAAIEAINRVEASGAHLLGALLTKAPENEGGYGYYGYRYDQIGDRTADKSVMITHQADA